GEAARRQWAEGPPDRLEPRVVATQERPGGGACPALRLLPRPLLRAAAQPRRGRARHCRVRRRVRQRRGQGAALRRAVPSREVGPGRPAPLAELRARLRRMILLPAVDIRDGKAVRLRQGRFEHETVYSEDPLEAARSFVEAGARFLHVVDLDGAREGRPVNLDHLRRITSELGVPVQYGGGLRTLVDVREALAAGAA